MQTNDYHSIISAISDLQGRGFFLDFSLVGNRLLCAQEKCYLKEDEFEVLEIYQFTDCGTTSDKTVIYAIESLYQPWKGILLNSSFQTTAMVPPILSQNIRKFWD